MTLRITVDSRDHYKVYRKYLVFWVLQDMQGRPWFNHLSNAEAYCERLCNKEKRKLEKPKVIKEIKCNEN